MAPGRCCTPPPLASRRTAAPRQSMVRAGSSPPSAAAASAASPAPGSHPARQVRNMPALQYLFAWTPYNYLQRRSRSKAQSIQPSCKCPDAGKKESWIYQYDLRSWCFLVTDLHHTPACLVKPCRPAGGDAHPGALPAAGGPAAQAAGGAAAQDHLLLRLPLRVWQRAAAGMGRAGGRRGARLHPAARSPISFMQRSCNSDKRPAQAAWLTFTGSCCVLTGVTPQHFGSKALSGLWKPADSQQPLSCTFPVASASTVRIADGAFQAASPKMLSSTSVGVSV
jgi:hypothetical protein